jgi:membrane protease subunit (stomatin/prohibitin family)
MGNELSVIKCETDNFQLVHKSTIENFNAKSQLIVNEAQEALFYKDGQALDLFASGRHTLDNENVPFLKRIFGKIFGGNTPFTCEVFFINKVSVMDILWGTDAPIVLEDPKYHLIVGVRANGQTGIRVKDSRKFVLKVVGQLRDYTVENVRRAIKGLMMTYVKETIASTIVNQGVTVLEISTRLSELSSIMQAKLNERLDDLGLEAQHFYVGTIFAGENDLAKLREAKEKRLEVMNDAELEAYKMGVLSEARAKARAVEGYTYQEERKFDVLEGAANNTGAAGNIVGAGIGLGMGFGMMGEVNKATGQMLGAQNAAPAAQNGATCPQCGASVSATAKFCGECGAKIEKKKRFCPECGNAIEPGSKFCPECGTKVGE